MSIFAKRHYEAVAAVIRENLETASLASCNSTAAWTQAQADAERMVSMLARDNPNFKADLFRKAAGLKA